MSYLAKRRVRIRSAYRRAEDGKVTASGERIQSPAHAPEPHAVHAARRAPRCRTHRHPVTGQSTASPAGAGTGSCRAGPQGQPEYDQHGSPREVSLFFSLSPLHTHTRINPHTYTHVYTFTQISPFPLRFISQLSRCQERREIPRTRGRSRVARRYSGSCVSSQRETFSLTSSPCFTSWPGDKSRRMRW